MTDDQTLVVRLRTDQQTVIERLRAAYDAKAEQRQPALDLASEAKRILQIDQYHGLTNFVVEMTINAIAGNTTQRDLSEGNLPEGKLAKVLSLERVFDPCESYENPREVLDPRASYNFLGVLLQGPSFATMENAKQYNTNMSALFTNTNLLMAIDYDTAAGCLRDLGKRLQQRNFSGLTGLGYLGSNFHHRVAEASGWGINVTLEIQNPSGPDYLVQESGRTRTRHPLQEYIADVAERVLQAKDKAIAAFDPKYRAGFLLEEK